VKGTTGFEGNQVRWIQGPREGLFRVYWSLNRPTEKGVIVSKQVRERLSADDADSLCTSLAAAGHMPFVAKSVMADG